MDRFGVGLRAGLVARITGVTFEEFSTRLLKPLEQVVHVKFDHRLGDWLYRSRHEHIAELVFDRILKSNAERAEQIVRILRYLNGAFENDRYLLLSFPNKSSCTTPRPRAATSGTKSRLDLMYESP